MIADTAELKLLELALAEVVVDTVKQGTAVVSKGALNIKLDAARRISGHTRHLPSYPQSINYDLAITGAAIEAEIGPSKDRRQGPLGNILEYGSPGRPPIPHLGPALDEEAPRFEAQIEALGSRLFSRYG